ncbi:MAG TPA: RidA family protein [Beijerinckiaceae bacterium]|nr:RidA family protein [Beijerinckiaceae bacterium]
MPRFLNPPTITPPSSRYSHGVAHDLHGRRLVISGQVGLRPDGTLADGLEAQLEQCWDNLIAVLRSADMDVADLVKVTIFVTVPEAIAISRQVRERKLGGHAPASTFLQVAGLARADFLAEIEAEAVKE